MTAWAIAIAVPSFAPDSFARLFRNMRKPLTPAITITAATTPRTICFWFAFTVSTVRRAVSANSFCFSWWRSLAFMG